MTQLPLFENLPSPSPGDDMTMDHNPMRGRWWDEPAAMDSNGEPYPDRDPEWELTHEDVLETAKRAYRIARATFLNHVALKNWYAAKRWEDETTAAHQALVRLRREQRAKALRVEFAVRDNVIRPDFGVREVA